MIRIKDMEMARHKWERVTLHIENTSTGEDIPLTLDTPKGTYHSGHFSFDFVWEVCKEIERIARKRWPRYFYDPEIIQHRLSNID